jgi:hypothetical protein
VGVPDVTIEGTNLGISINRADANGVVANLQKRSAQRSLSARASLTPSIWTALPGALLQASGTLTVRCQ